MFRRIWIRKRNFRLFVYISCLLLFLYFIRVFLRPLNDESGIENKSAGDNNDVSDIMRYRKLRFEEYNSRKNNRVGPGEYGKPVVLTGEEKEQADKLFTKEAFNIVVSDKVALDRSVPDTRDEE